MGHLNDMMYSGVYSIRPHSMFFGFIFASFLIGLICLVLYYNIPRKNRYWMELPFLEKSAISFVVGAISAIGGAFMFLILWLLLLFFRIRISWAFMPAMAVLPFLYFWTYYFVKEKFLKMHSGSEFEYIKWFILDSFAVISYCAMLTLSLFLMASRMYLLAIFLYLLFYLLVSLPSYKKMKK